MTSMASKGSSNRTECLSLPLRVHPLPVPLSYYVKRTHSAMPDNRRDNPLGFVHNLMQLLKSSVTSLDQR